MVWGYVSWINRAFVGRRFPVQLEFSWRDSNLCSILSALLSAKWRSFNAVADIIAHGNLATVGITINTLQLLDYSPHIAGHSGICNAAYPIPSITCQGNRQKITLKLRQRKQKPTFSPFSLCYHVCPMPFSTAIILCIISLAASLPMATINTADGSASPPFHSYHHPFHRICSVGWGTSLLDYSQQQSNIISISIILSPPTENPSADQYLSTSIARVSHGMGGTLVLLLPQEITRRRRLEDQWSVGIKQSGGTEGGHAMSVSI